MEDVQNTLNHLRGFVSKAHKAIEALEELEKAGIIPPGTVVNPRQPEPVSSKSKPPKDTGKSIPSTGEKRCKKCGDIKPLDSFPLNKKCADGHLKTCKECRKPRTQERKKKQKDNPPVIGSEKPPAVEKGKRKSRYIYSCKKCGQGFNTLLALETHMDLKHPKK